MDISLFLGSIPASSSQGGGRILACHRPATATRVSGRSAAPTFDIRAGFIESTFRPARGVMERAGGKCALEGRFPTPGFPGWGLWGIVPLTVCLTPLVSN